ncbi:MAG TPA: MucB/RseB C-terminal domain-containing protein [Steroidobacteraceae bacterium]|nr:MucB/RseB C-terminal domain-containing protein [Steroidobacteraceae bacterium]
MRRTVESFPAGWATLLLAVAGTAQAEEPRLWLERMNEALTQNNYEGEFQHWQRGKVENLRIIHRVQNGQVMERLVSLDGSGREFIRTGTELTCYLPDRRVVLVERRAADAPLLGALPSIDESTASFYDITEVKRTRVNRRDTRVIAVNPKDEFRYGYRLWIDESTAMPIRTQLCDARGRVIEQINFTSLKLPSRIPDTAFEPEVSTAGFQWLRNDAQLPSNPAPALWSALRLPPGFRMTVRAAQTLPGSSDPVEHIVFTDGFASVSVFVEQKVKSAPGPAISGSARVGSSSTFSTVIDGSQVTAVGEVPPQTVRFIANSMKADRLTIQPPRIQPPRR